MDLNLALKCITVAILILCITIPLGIKITRAIKKIFSKTENDNPLAQSDSVTSVGGRDTFAAQETHIHQGDYASGERRKALRALKKANDGLNWAIGQSRNPHLRYSPESYVSKLQDTFKSNFAKFKKTDLELLEPIHSKIINNRTQFSELAAPCTEFNTAIESLK